MKWFPSLRFLVLLSLVFVLVPVLVSILVLVLVLVLVLMLGFCVSVGVAIVVGGVSVGGIVKITRSPLPPVFVSTPQLCKVLCFLPSTYYPPAFTGYVTRRSNLKLM